MTSSFLAARQAGLTIGKAQWTLKRKAHVKVSSVCSKLVIQIKPDSQDPGIVSSVYIYAIRPSALIGYIFDSIRWLVERMLIQFSI